MEKLMTNLEQKIRKLMNNFFVFNFIWNSQISRKGLAMIRTLGDFAFKKMF